MIYVLGANGFLGSALCKYFEVERVSYVAVQRSLPKNEKQTITLDQFIKNLAANKFSKADTIVNCIGAAHLNYKVQKTTPEIFNEANIDRCVEVAKLAVKSNVGRFVHISSIAVLGHNLNSIIRLETEACPREPYGMSKHLAEVKLKQLYDKTPNKLIILRPSLVYGKGAKGNFRKLCKIVNLNIPLPFSGMVNKKSFLSDMNFASLVHHMCTKDFTDPVTLNLSDVEQNTMLDFMKLIAAGQKKKLFVFYFPLKMVKLAFYVLRKQEYFEKLSEDFSIDMDEVIEITGWSPAESQEQAIKRIMEGYNRN